MRKLLILLAFSVVFPAAAQAEGKVNGLLGWFPPQGEWNEYTRYNPHLENGRHTHPGQWTDEDLDVSSWAEQRGSGLELVQNFYRADIVRDQIMEETVPVVTVGPNFYRLGGQDKRRVIKSIDEVYGVTAQNPYGTIILRDWHTRKDIGAYTASNGLMIE